MRSPRCVVNVEAAIVRDERYLLVVRGDLETHAPGVLSLPGGKVEHVGNADDVLEDTLRREMQEEVGLDVHPDLEYVESKSFIADDGTFVVDVVFLCRCRSGTPTIGDPGEVADIRWMTAAEVLEHPKVPPWTRRSVHLAEEKRRVRGW